MDSRRVSFSFNLHFLISRSSDPVALREAAQVIQSHLTKGDSPTVGPVTVRLVEYWLSRLRDRHEGQIVEPLAYLSLMKWLNNHPDQIASKSPNATCFSVLTRTCLRGANHFVSASSTTVPLAQFSNFTVPFLNGLTKGPRSLDVLMAPP